MLQLCGLNPRFAHFRIDSGHAAGECGVTNGIKLKPVDEQSFNLPISVMIKGHGTAMGTLQYKPADGRAWRATVLRAHLITRLKSDVLEVTEVMLGDLYALRIKEYPAGVDDARAGNSTIDDALRKAVQTKTEIQKPVVGDDQRKHVATAESQTIDGLKDSKPSPVEACTPLASNEADLKTILKAISQNTSWVAGGEFSSKELHRALEVAFGLPVASRAMPGVVTVLRNNGYISDVPNKNLMYRVGKLPPEYIEAQAHHTQTQAPPETPTLTAAPASVTGSIEERVAALQKQIEAAASYETEFLRLKDAHGKIVAKITTLQEEQRGLETLMQDLSGRINNLSALRQKLALAEGLLKQANEALVA